MIARHADLKRIYQLNLMPAPATGSEKGGGSRGDSTRQTKGENDRRKVMNN
jgi:hypothetical protein